MSKATTKAKGSGKELEPAAKKRALTTGGIDFKRDKGKGMEGTTAESFAIPFLAVLQKGSPQVDEASSKGLFIKGAKQGEIFNTVTKARLPGDKGVLLVCCAYKRVFLRWGPRGGGGEGGGFKGEVLPEDIAKMRTSGVIGDLDNRTYFKLPDGSINPKKCDLIQDHRNHFVLAIDEKTKSFYQALISLKSTQIKKSKNLMSALDGVKLDDPDGGPSFTPPTFANIVRMTTVPESNDDGSWYGVDFTLEGEVDDADLYAAALHLNEQFTKNAINVNYNAMAEAEGQGGDGKKGF